MIDVNELAGVPPRRTKKQIRDLARNIVDDRVWTVLGVDLADVLMMFPAYAALAPKLSSDQRRLVVPVGVLGEHETWSRSINGRPVFMQCELWHHEDLVSAFLIAKRAIDAVEAILDESTEGAGDGGRDDRPG